MAITTPTLIGNGQMPIARTGPLAINDVQEGDATTAVQIIASPGAGKSLFLTSVTISGRTSDQNVTVLDEDGTVLFGPIAIQEDGETSITKDWKSPLKITSDKDLDVKASANSDFTIYVEYFIGEDEV